MSWTRHMCIGLGTVMAAFYCASSAEAQIVPGDFLAVEDPVCCSRELYKVHWNGLSFTTTILNDGLFNVVHVTDSGRILVFAEAFDGADRDLLYEVDPVDGSLTVVSCAAESTPVAPCLTSVGAGPPIVGASGIAHESGDSIVVSAEVSFTTPHQGTIFRIDLDTGNRTVVSGWDSDTSANRGAFNEWNVGPSDVAVKANGSILALAREETQGSNWVGSVYEINPVNGDRFIVSGPGRGEDLGGSNQVFGLGVQRIAVSGVEGAETIYTSGVRRGLGLTNIWAVDPNNGNRRVISGMYPNTATFVGAGTMCNWLDLTLDLFGALVVSCERTSGAGIVHIDPITGDRTHLFNPSPASQSISGVPAPAGSGQAVPALGGVGLGLLAAGIVCAALGLRRRVLILTTSLNLHRGSSMGSATALGCRGARNFSPVGAAESNRAG